MALQMKNKENRKNKFYHFHIVETGAVDRKLINSFESPERA
jgi:hypothetical protein